MITVDAIFFDVDGTLVDARIDIANAINYALQALGLEKKEQDEIISYVGTGVKDLVRKTLGKSNSKFSEEAHKLFSDYYAAHSHDSASLYPHAVEILKHFENKRKFILTNRYSKFAEAALKGLGIRGFFLEIIGGDNENCLKPSACVLDSIFPRLKVEKDKAIIVGDMDIDILTGKNSGIGTCWVTYGLGKAEDVKPLKPDYIIDDLLELKGIIN